MTENKTAFSKIKNHATASIWCIGANAVSRGAAFFFTPIFTRLLTPEEYGIYPLYVSLMGIFTVVTTFEISGNAIYKGLAKFEDDENGFLCSAVASQILMSILSLILYGFFREKLNSLTALTAPLSVLLVLQIFMNSVEGIHFAKKRYRGQHRGVSVINGLSGILSPPLALVFINLGLGGSSRILAPFIISAVITLPILIDIIKKGRKFFTKKYWSFLFRFSIPMIPHYLSLAIIAQSDKIIIARLVGEEAVGKYSAAYSSGFVISLITAGIGTVLTPWIIKRLKENKHGAISEITEGATMAVSLCTLAFLCIAPEVFRIVANNEYYEALPVVYLVSLSVILSFVNGITTAYIVHFEKTHLITKNSLITAAVSIILGIAFVKTFGYIGGAYITLLSYALLLILNHLTLRKLLKNEEKKKWRVFKTPLAALIAATVIFFLKDSLTARIIMLTALILITVDMAARYKQIIYSL